MATTIASPIRPAGRCRIAARADRTDRPEVAPARNGAMSANADAWIDGGMRKIGEEVRQDDGQRNHEE